MKKWCRNKIFEFFVCLLLISFSWPVYSEADYAVSLQGSVKAYGDRDKISLTLLDVDNIILDITNAKNDGTYKIDLSVLDNPTYTEVKKLYLQLERDGEKKKIKLIEYILKMSDVVELRPVEFP